MIRSGLFLSIKFPQTFLSFDKWEIPQIFVIEPQQIECIEHGRTSSQR